MAGPRQSGTRRPTGRSSGTGRSGARRGTQRTTGKGGAQRTSGGRRSAPKRNNRNRRRTANRPLFTRLWFWVAVCLIIIVVVLFTKGCDTGSIDAGGTTEIPETHAIESGEGQAGAATESATKAPTTPSAPVSTPSTQATTPTQAPTQATTDRPTSSGATQGTTAATEGRGEGATTPTETVYFANHYVAAGTQLIGADLPAGTVDITVLGGSGSLATSDGVLSYPAFGKGYTESVAGVQLRSGVSITVSGNLEMKFSYLTEPVTDRKGASPTETVYTLTGTDGNTVFTVGSDITPGVYTVSVVDGYGEVVTSDAASGTGINEMIGLTDVGGNYLQTVKNVTLNEGVTLTVRGCTVRLTLMEDE